MSEELKFLSFQKDIEVFDNIIPQEMADSVENGTEMFFLHLLRDIEKFKLTEENNYRVVNDETPLIHCNLSWCL